MKTAENILETLLRVSFGRTTLSRIFLILVYLANIARLVYYCVSGDPSPKLPSLDTSLPYWPSKPIPSLWWLFAAVIFYITLWWNFHKIPEGGMIRNPKAMDYTAFAWFWWGFLRVTAIHWMRFVESEMIIILASSVTLFLITMWMLWRTSRNFERE